MKGRKFDPFLLWPTVCLLCALSAFQSYQLWVHSKELASSAAIHEINWCVTKHILVDRYGEVPEHDSYEEWQEIEKQRHEKLMACWE